MRTLLAALAVLAASGHAADVHDKHHNPLQSPTPFFSPVPSPAGAAEFLYQTVRFVRWPDARLAEGPFLVGVVGQDPIAHALRAVWAGRRIAGRPVVFLDRPGPARMRECHMVYIALSERGRLSAILPVLRGSRVLTASALEGFAAHGGMIEIGPGAEGPRLEISPAAALRGGIGISSRLLRRVELAGPPERVE